MKPELKILYISHSFYCLFRSFRHLSLVWCCEATSLTLIERLMFNFVSSSSSLMMMLKCVRRSVSFEIWSQVYDGKSQTPAPVPSTPSIQAAALHSSVTPSSVKMLLRSSVTRFGDLLHFGQPFKACGNNYFSQIAHISGNFVQVSKSFIFGQLL